MSIEVSIKNYSDEIIEAMHDKVMIALEMCGEVAETAAKDNITINGSVDTGNLRNSITHTVSEWSDTCYVGTPVEYGTYIEMGTYKMAAKPFLRPAVEGNADQFAMIFEAKLRQ